jgi:hypothetical protein
MWMFVTAGLRPQIRKRPVCSARSSGSWISQAPAEQVEEALAEDLQGRERPVALVVEDGQAAVAVLRRAQPLGGEVERVVPRDPLPARLRPAQRMEHAIGVVEAVRVKGCSGSPPSRTMRPSSTWAMIPHASKQSSEHAVRTVVVVMAVSPSAVSRRG